MADGEATPSVWLVFGTADLERFARIFDLIRSSLASADSFAVGPKRLIVRELGEEVDA